MPPGSRSPKGGCGQKSLRQPSGAIIILLLGNPAARLLLDSLYNQPQRMIKQVLFYGFNDVQKVTIRGRSFNVLQFTLRVVYHQLNQRIRRRTI
jgi:hypothetical protein